MRWPAPPSTEILSALAVLVVVGGLLVPLPLPLLDLLLALNLGLSLALLASTLLLADPLRLSAFPTLLLVSTLFRLALNVSSTRAILGHGEAGRIIEAFGAFVVGGSTVVGAVVFAILVVVQLVVVSKGAERVAEVGARFTLDGLPGKQLSIDADLRAGSCTQAEGMRRRAALEAESRFYGALDGAMKFVKGDAVAGLLITAINVLGGLGLGVLGRGLSLADAAARFTLLSIGDGLVSLLPALLSAVAAGVLVTRVGRPDASAGTSAELFTQLTADPRAPLLSALVLLLLATVPGLPLWPFLVAAAVLGAGSAAAYRRQRQPPRETSQAEPAPALGSAAPPPRSSADARRAPALVLEVPAASAELASTVLPRVRRAVAQHLGVPVPAIEVCPTSAWEGHFALRHHGALLERGVLLDRPLLLLDADEARLLGIEGQPIPHGGTAALVPDRAGLEVARRCQIPALEPGAHLEENLTRALLARASEWVTLQASASLLASLETRSPALLEEVRAHLSSVQVHRLFVGLMAERVPLRPLERALEAALECPPERVEPDGIAAARRALGRQIVEPYLEGGALPVLLLDPVTDATLHEALTESGTTLALSPGDQNALCVAYARALCEGPVVLLTPAALRPALARLLRDTAPLPAPVMAYDELPADLPLRPTGRLALPPVALDHHEPSARPASGRSEPLPDLDPRPRPEPLPGPRPPVSPYAAGSPEPAPAVLA